MTAITPEMIEAGCTAMTRAVVEKGDPTPIYTAMRALEAPSVTAGPSGNATILTTASGSGGGPPYGRGAQGSRPTNWEELLHGQITRLSTERDELRSALETAVERYEEDCSRPEHWAYDARALLARIKGAE